VAWQGVPPFNLSTYQERIGVRVPLAGAVVLAQRSDLMNPSGVMASFLPTRVFKIATLSLSVVLSVAVAVHAQAQQMQRPASREARPGTKQDFLGWLRQFAPTPRGQSRAVPFPPLPRPRPAELTATPMEPMSEKLAPTSVQSDQTQTPTEPAPAPDEPNEGPLND
jgi:hypothetical protein